MISRFLRIAACSSDRAGIWDVRVVLETEDGSEVGAFLKFKGDEQPAPARVRSEVEKYIEAANAPPIDPLGPPIPDEPTISYRQRLTTTFKDFFWTLLGY